MKVQCQCPTCGAPAIRTSTSTFPQYEPDTYKYVGSDEAPKCCLCREEIRQHEAYDFCAVSDDGCHVMPKEKT